MSALGCQNGPPDTSQIAVLHSRRVHERGDGTSVTTAMIRSSAGLSPGPGSIVSLDSWPTNE